MEVLNRTTAVYGSIVKKDPAPRSRYTCPVLLNLWMKYPGQRLQRSPLGEMKLFLLPRMMKRYVSWCHRYYQPGVIKSLWQRMDRKPYRYQTGISETFICC